jgi:hypothetical protein
MAVAVVFLALALAALALSQGLEQRRSFRRNSDK